MPGQSRLLAWDRLQPNETGLLPRACARLTVVASFPLTLENLNARPSLKQQEIPLKHPESCHMFLPGPDKPLVATPAAIEMYSHETIIACWHVLCELASRHDGLDYLQVFETRECTENLWFIEDGTGGAITALLPSDY